MADRDKFREMTTSVSLGLLSDLFQFIDKYSPFNEMFETDEELIAKLRGQSGQSEQQSSSSSGSSATSGSSSSGSGGGVRVFSVSELAENDGSPGSPGLLLALLGEVYDVSGGEQYYGPGGGYSFFAGRDASRAFVTGQFDLAGLVDNVEDLPSSDYLGLQDWAKFYASDYRKVGVLAGRYFTTAGEPTQYWRDLQGWLAAAQQERDKNDVEKNMFPPCNVEWSQAEGSRYWCTKKSGGVSRDWVGVPRQLFYPGREPRCACVRTRGPPSTDPGAATDRGDRDSPHLQSYPGCDGLDFECRGVREEK